MLAKRIIACLDCDLGRKEGRVVKGIQFQKIRYAGLPHKLAERYSLEGADEIVFLDITASRERRETMKEIVRKTAKKVFIPLTVGGGIKTPKDAAQLFKAGADKVSINTAAIKTPKLISQLANVFGSQAVVVAIDAKKRYDKQRVWYECAIYGGTRFTGIDALEWAKRAAKLGAGEILLTSVDRDGTKQGFDSELTKKIAEAVIIPVIASGGAGKKEHFAQVLTRGRADAALAASLFHFKEITIPALKKYLQQEGVPIRI